LALDSGVLPACSAKPPCRPSFPLGPSDPSPLSLPLTRIVPDPLSDIDVLSYYLSGLTPKKVHSFGSIGHFKPSKKPAEAGDAKRCFDCAYESKCVWSAKKIYVEPLKGTEDTERVCRASLLRQASIAERRASSVYPSLLSPFLDTINGRPGYSKASSNATRRALLTLTLQWAKHVVDADVLDIENVSEALKTTSPYGRCVYECGNDVVDHQVVNVEYEGGVTASMTMSACE
jgi:hypothetical protein